MCGSGFQPQEQKGVVQDGLFMKKKYFFSFVPLALGTSSRAGTCGCVHGHLYSPGLWRWSIKCTQTRMLPKRHSILNSLTPSLRQGSGLEKVISHAEFLAEDVAELVECLPRMHEALGLNPQCCINPVWYSSSVIPALKRYR